MLFQNLIGKNDQPIVYAYRLFNRVEHNYNTTTTRKHGTFLLANLVKKYPI